MQLSVWRGIVHVLCSCRHVAVRYNVLRSCQCMVHVWYSCQCVVGLCFSHSLCGATYSTDSEINMYCCCGTCPVQLSMYRDMVHVWLATYNAIVAMKVPAASGGPLNFCRQQSSNCPAVLSQVASHVLTISASSAQSERYFSSVGHTLTDLRTRLSANKVEAVELLRWGLQAGMQSADAHVTVLTM